MDYDDIDPDLLTPGQTASFDVEVYFWKYKPDRSRVVGHLLQVMGD
ncbi:MAG: hypothetical protein R2873_24590 [Caldilineaceae bacterium]